MLTIHERERLQDAIQRRDPGAFVCATSNEHGLWNVCRHSTALAAAGMYEACLVRAFAGSRTNNAAWSVSDVLWMLDRAERSRLLAAGDLLPHAGPFMVYRGVAGKGRSRSVRGLSWTGSREVAAWFAIRYQLPDPAIYTAVVRVEDVYFYTDQRSEQEFVTRPSRATRVSLSPDEIRSLAGEHERASQARKANRLSQAAPR